MNSYTFLLLISCFLLACGTKPNKQETITASQWKLQGIVSRPFVTAKKDSIPAEPFQKETVQIIYQFHKDKKYTFLRGTQTDKGGWGMSSDEKVLLLRSHTQASENSEFHIHTIEASQLIISTEHNGRQEILYFAAK